LYQRIKRLYKVIFPAIKPEEIQQAAQILPVSAFALFCRQALPEQRHALDVADSLQRQGIFLSLSVKEYGNLISAALLHDCGKSLVQIRLWQRVAISLLGACPWPFLKNYLRNRKCHSGRFVLTLDIAEQHAEWGEFLAKQAGLNRHVCLLIRQHHSPCSKLGRILQEHDNKN
jgi:hypothetical protein